MRVKGQRQRGQARTRLRNLNLTHDRALTLNRIRPPQVLVVYRRTQAVPSLAALLKVCNFTVIAQLGCHSVVSLSYVVVFAKLGVVGVDWSGRLWMTVR